MPNARILGVNPTDAQGEELRRTNGRERQPGRHRLLLVVLGAIVVWVRLLPLSLQGLDEQADEEVRLQVAESVATGNLESDAAEARVDDWISQHREEFDRRLEARANELKADVRYRGADGRDYVFLGDSDSYTWLRAARNYLKTGTTCDAIVDGDCRDTYTHAPVGVHFRYARSLHIAAIVALHRLITIFQPDFPLPASAFLVPVLVASFGVFPAFAIACRFAGPIAGVWAVILVNASPIFLERSAGSDNDVWNVMLPLWMIWAAVEALRGTTLRRRILFTVLAAGFAAIHAATWNGWVFTYNVLLMALVAIVVSEAAGAAWRGRHLRLWQFESVRDTATVLAAFYLAAAVLTAFVDLHESYFRLPVDLWNSVVGGKAARLPTDAAEELWPNILPTVAEMARPNLQQIGSLMGGSASFFVGWLGLLLLVLPRRDWQSWHFVILLAGNFLYGYLLTVSDLRRVSLLFFLALPLAAAVGTTAIAKDDETERQQTAGLILIVWFVAALFLSYGGSRFVMLLVPAFALAASVAVGRLHQWLKEQIVIIGPRSRTVASCLLFGVFIAALFQPARLGYESARTYLPRMNGAWARALTAIRQTTSPETIINSWWDFGYYIKYVAERRVSADGSSLSTHLPYWVARALVAEDERESQGLLRMLNCGSEATPEPEGRLGAFGKLIAFGVDAITAQSLVVELAGRNSSQARTTLAQRGLPSSVHDEIVATTHCQTPPSYLILSDRMSAMTSWRVTGLWDFRKAYIAKQLRFLSSTVAVDELVQRFAFSEADARRVYQEASSLVSEEDVQAFISPPISSALADWIACRPAQSGDEITCPVGMILDDVTLLRGITIVSSSTTYSARVRLQHRGGDDEASPTMDEVPTTILIAGDKKMESREVADLGHPELAVLFDVPKMRALIAPAPLLRSTFVQLRYLDGRFTPHFSKVDSQISANGETVVTWKVVWDD